MDAKIDLELLVAFTAVAGTANFSAAARQLGVPTSTVSRRVAALEAALGRQLLHRTTRKVALTTDGEALLRGVGPHLAAVQQALASVPARDELPSGLLRVTAPVDLGAFFVADVVARYALRFPAVRLELTLTNRVVDLVAEGFDLALRVAARLADSSLVTRRVGRLGGALFASPTYVARRGAPRSVGELDDHDWVIFRGVPRLALEAAGRTVTVAPAARILCDDLMFVRAVLRAGAGIGWLPSFLAQPDVEAGALVRVLPRHRTSSGFLWLVWPATRHVPGKVTAFRDVLLESIRGAMLAPAED